MPISYTSPSIEDKNQLNLVKTFLKESKVSIFVPCYNSEKTIKQCLESIFSQTYPIDEVLVIDDGSTDRTTEIASKFLVKLIKNEKNKGIAYTRNVGFNNAKNELVASLDSDCVAGKNWLRDLIKHMSETVGGVGGKLVDKNNKKISDAWCSFHMEQDWGSNKVINPEYLFGNNTLYKKYVIKKAGYFDPKFKTNYEDVDISKRILKHNFTLIYSPEAIVYHLKTDNFYTLFKRFWLWNLHTTSLPTSLIGLKRQIGHNIAKARYCLRKDIKQTNYKFIPIDFMIFPILSLFDILRYFKNEK